MDRKNMTGDRDFWVGSKHINQNFAEEVEEWMVICTRVEK